MQRLVNHRQLREQLLHAVGVPTARFARALAHATPTRSGLEDRFLATLRRHALPAPETNVEIGGFEVDGLYAAARIVVEVDSVKFHSSPPARRRDARKQAALEAAGYRVVRVSEHDVDDGTAAASKVRAALAATVATT